MDDSDREILNLSGCLYHIIFLHTVHVEFLLKRYLSFQTAYFSIFLIAAVQYPENKASL